MAFQIKSLTDRVKSVIGGVPQSLSNIGDSFNRATSDDKGYIQRGRLTNPNRIISPVPENRMESQVARTINSPLYKFGAKAGQTFAQSPKILGEGYGTAISQKFFDRPSLDKISGAAIDLQRQAAQFESRGNIKAAKALRKTAQSLAGDVATKELGLSQEAQKATNKVIGGSVGTGLTVLGGKYINPKNLLVAGGLGGTINSAFGGSFSEGAGQGVGGLAKTMGLVRFTGPVIQKLSSKILTGEALYNAGLTSTAAQQLFARSISGVGNVIEDRILAKVDGVDRSTVDDVISFALASVLDPSANTQLTKFVNENPAGAPAKKAILESVNLARNIIGQLYDTKSGQFVLEQLQKYSATLHGSGKGYDADINRPTKLIQNPNNPNQQVRVFSDTGQPVPNVEMRAAESGFEVKDTTDPLTQEARKYKSAELRYVRNPEKSMNMGSRFGQDIEPAGKYMSLMDEGQSYVPPGWETGKVSFKNPLVLDWGEGYTSGKNWKNILSEKYGGKKGKELSSAIAKDGYDGIITLDKGKPSEVVSLTDIWNKANGQKGEISNDLMQDVGGGAVGSLAGFEKDENGKWRYNPTKGAFGAAVGVGASRQFSGRGVRLGLGTEDVSKGTEYKRGEITRIEKEVDDILGTEGYMMRGKWKERNPARMTAIKELEYYAATIPEAKATLDKVEGLLNQLSNARDLRKGIKQPTIKIVGKKAISQTKTPEVSQPRTMKVTSGQKFSSQPSTSSKNASFDKSIPKTFDEAYSKFIADRDIAQVTATQRAKVLTDIPTARAREVIDYREGVTTKATPEVKAWADKMGSVYKELHSEITAKAKQVGLGVGEIENYVPHYWKESPEAVQQAFLSANKKPGQIKGRIIPTYKEGIEMGLTPKYKHPAQMLEQYVRDMERFGAGIDFIKTLKEQGEIIYSPKQGYSRVDAPGLGGGNMYARSELAQQISRLLSPESQTGIGDVFAKTAKFAGGLQDLTLSGGLPGTPINAFTIAQIQKELIAGNVVSPFKAVYNSLSTTRTQKFFDTNAPQVKKMLERNVPVRSGYGVDEMIDQSTAKRVFGDGIGNAWSKLINEPTFKRFMPMLQVNLFNQIEAGAIKSGMNEKQAADVAAESVRKFYGLVDTAKSAKRSKIGKDITGTFLFAPHYRESMINMWVETVKSLKNPLARENRMNVRFAIGAVATYLAMNQINQQVNGHGMNDNPERKKDKLLIPLGDGQTLGIPFLSSIATIPRMGIEMARQAGQGDITGVASEGRKALSMAIKPLVDVMANSDYFERNIVEETDTPGEKLKKQGEYLLKSYAGHPYIRELIELYTKPEKPVYQRLSNAMELPLRFYSTESIELAPFWDKYSDLKIVQARYEAMKYDDPAKANDYLNENEEAINELNLMKAYLKANYDQADEGLEQTSLKEYLAQAKAEAKYESSEDAPKDEKSKRGLLIKSAVTNPIDTYNAYKTGQPIRKMRGDATILERQLGPTDKNKDTEKDHRIPLWAGGTNEDKNTYYLSTSDHAAKTKFEEPLREKLENGELNKSQVQKQIQQWHKDNNIQSVAPPIKKSTLKVKGKNGEATGETYEWTDGNGNVQNLSISPPKEPTYTGNAELDKKLKSKYKGSVSKAGNNIIKLYEAGTLSADEAGKAMDKLAMATKKTSKGRKGKKGAKVTFSKVKAGRVKSTKLKFGKAPTVKKTRKLVLKKLTTESKERRIRA